MIFVLMSKQLHNTHMKKTIILALAMALPVMAGDDKGATVKVVEYPPVVTPAPVESPWALELAGVHTWTMADAGDDMHNINTWGVDATVVYNIDDNWATTIRFGWAEGSDRKEYFGDHVCKRQVTNWSLTAGVRYTAPITEKLSWFAGANLGWGRTEIKDYFSAGPDGSWKDNADDVGLYYSAEVGLKYDICERLYATGAIGVRGVWTTPNGGMQLDGDDLGAPRSSRYDQQFGMSVSAGLGWDF